MPAGPLRVSQIVAPPVCGCVYGRPGIGKTIFACGSQSMNIFHMDIDSGVLSLASKETDKKLAAAGYPPVQRNNIITWPISLEKPWADFEAGLAWFEAYRTQFHLVVVDTATELQRILADDVMKKKKHIIADQQDWGQILNVMESLARGFRSYGVHAIFLGHETTRHNRTTGTTTFMPNFKGQFGDDYAKHFSWIARYFLQQQQELVNGVLQFSESRWLNNNLDTMTDAKDRSSALDKYELPLVDNIFAKILSATAANQS